MFIEFSAKPAPLRNCTLRPYTTTSLTSSSNLTTYNTNGGQNLKELNYINTQYVKDRNVSNDKKSTTPTKFNQKKYSVKKREFSSSSDEIVSSNTGSNIKDVGYNDNKIKYSARDRNKSNLSYMTSRVGAGGKYNERISKRNVKMEFVEKSKSRVNETKSILYETGIKEQTQFDYLKTDTKPNTNQNGNNNNMDTYETPPSVMELECVAGYDGGLTQNFILEAYDSRTKKLRLNITSAFTDIPLFRIDLTGTLLLRKLYI